MAALGLAESDLVERFFCPSRGRSRKRKSQTGVQLRHEATGLEVRCEKSSSQPLTRFHARRLLVELLEERELVDERAGAPPASAVAPAARGAEFPEQHMERMFARSFERDIAQPYPIPSQRLLGAGDPFMKRIGILGERETPGPRKKGEAGPR